MLGKAKPRGRSEIGWGARLHRQWGPTKLARGWGPYPTAGLKQVVPPIALLRRASPTALLAHFNGRRGPTGTTIYPSQMESEQGWVTGRSEAGRFNDAPPDPGARKGEAAVRPTTLPTTKMESEEGWVTGRSEAGRFNDAQRPQTPVQGKAKPRSDGSTYQIIQYRCKPDRHPPRAWSDRIRLSPKWRVAHRLEPPRRSAT
ncbi:MAG: hypothetical protein IPK82_31065 [Polyangiaceae bacterium]|nr:hypothetical protein [Polyangiaceae bacterium]